MKLVLMRKQGGGMMGGTNFSLTAKVELTDEEKDNISKYKLGNVLLYTNLEDRGKGIAGMISRKLVGIEIRINDLINGKTVGCKSILEMMDVEETITESVKTFKQVLEMSSTFGGETVIEI